MLRKCQGEPVDASILGTQGFVYWLIASRVVWRQEGRGESDLAYRGLLGDQAFGLEGCLATRGHRGWQRPQMLQA